MSAVAWGVVRPEAVAVLGVLPLALAGAVLLRAVGRRWLRRFAEPAADAEPRPLRGAGGPLAAAALLAAAVIGPAVGEHLVEVPVRAIDVLVLLDASRSMNVADADPDRLGRAKRELLDLAARFRGGRLGLMTFGGDADLVCPFTRDRAAFADFVRAVDPIFRTRGGTDLGRALRRAAAVFEGSDARRVVLVATDGEHLGDPAGVDEAAWLLAGSGVEVHALVVGTEAGGFVPAAAPGAFLTDEAGDRVRSRARPDALRPVVARTGGRLVMARARAFPLARLVDEELSDVVAIDDRTTLRREPVDRYRWLLAPALLLLLWPWVPRPVRRRPRTAALALAVAAPWLLAFAAADWRDAVRRGNERYAAGAYEEALARYDEALAAAPDDPGVRFNRGAALHRQGRYRDAARAFDGARALGGGALHVRASFGAGVARARQAERALAAAGDDPRRLEAVGSLLREAKGDFVQALAGGAGRDAAVDLEIVSLLLDELRRRQESGRPEGDAGGAGGEAEPGEGEPSPDEEGGETAGARSEAGTRTAIDETATADDPDAPPGADAPVDEEGGGEARLPGGLFREEARSIEEIVRRYERERLELDRRRARAQRAGAERDW